MARTTSVNYSAPSFPKATAATDPFLMQDIQSLAEALDTHDHTTGKGLAVSGGGGGGLTLPLTQTLTFSPDNTQDIGTNATTARPRDLFLGRNLTVGGTATLAADPTLPLQAATKQYADTKLTQTQADARYPLKTDTDPYPSYLTQTEGDARYETPAQSAALYLPLTGGTLSGNLGFSGTTRRITGDFSNATVANRVLLQSSVANGASSVGVIPNGTSRTGALALFNTNTPDNSGYLGLVVDNATALINSDRLGTGAYVPLVFSTGGAERMRIDTAGTVTIGTTGPKMLPLAANSLSIEAPGQWLMLSGKLSSNVSGNAYFDGTNWQRYDVAQPATQIITSQSNVQMRYVAAGANPITWAANFFVGDAATGAVTLPAGTANKYLGGYTTQTAFSTTTAAAWVETPAQVTVTCSGKRLRISGRTALQTTTANAIQAAVGMDGTALVNVGIFSTPANNVFAFPFTVYYTPAAGSHRFSIFAQQTNAGTLSYNANTPWAIDIEEITC